ncbi:MAG TPA: hypothetical protein VFG42_02385 [Baekduia sp.]|uniref:hypothetical protein n=1 Tax=Baekduia sp. TaxID=2600305 RepID=UPI002D78701E|nr:hypothetical protein [Baekduia sp.]HET6505614.1 hypothetical protein [Baekduia sp.]
MATLRVKDQGAGPRIYARWRDGSRYVERLLGPGWLVRVDDAGAKPNGKTIGDWRERRGRPAEGFLTVDAATQAVPAAIEAWRETSELDETQATATRLRAQSARAGAAGATARRRSRRHLRPGGGSLVLAPARREADQGVEPP